MTRGRTGDLSCIERSICWGCFIHWFDEDSPKQTRGGLSVAEPQDAGDCLRSEMTCLYKENSGLLIAV